MSETNAAATEPFKKKTKKESDTLGHRQLRENTFRFVWYICGRKQGGEQQEERDQTVSQELSRCPTG